MFFLAIGTYRPQIQQIIYWLIMTAATFACANPLANPTTTITISSPATLATSDTRHYYQQLLILALEKTRTSHGNYKITHNRLDVGPERERAMLMANAGLDVVWGSVTHEREESMQVIPVDLVKNLNSYRILFIKHDTQSQFSPIKTLAEFRTLTSGSGINWSHNTTLIANDIKVTTSGSFQGLYKMLAAGRFAYVARAPYEAAAEIETFAQYGVNIETHLLLKFSKQQRYSFFVRKIDRALAKRIEEGLTLAQADGIDVSRLMKLVADTRPGLSSIGAPASAELMPAGT